MPKKKFNPEPLDFRKVSSSPTMSGMVSFLEDTPEFYQSLLQKTSVGERTTGSERPTPPVILTITGSERTTGVSTTTSLPHLIDSAVDTVAAGIERVPEAERTTGIPTPTGVKRITGNDRPIGIERITPPAIREDFFQEEEEPVVERTPRFERTTGGANRIPIRRMVLAQDGHSLGEQALYAVMWAEGLPETEDPNGSRVLRMGYQELGFKARMGKKAIRLNLHSLVEKLSIERIETFVAWSSTAITYRIFSYKQILARRKAAGLEFYVKHRGVTFVTEQGTPLTRRTPVSQKAPGIERTTGAWSRKDHGERDQRTTPPDGERTTPPGIQRTTPYSQGSLAKTLEKQQGREESTSSTSMFPLVSQAFTSLWQASSTDTRQLVSACLTVRPDVQDHEILRVLEYQSAMVRQNTAIRNPIGFLLWKIPQVFEGESFETMRATWARQKAEREEAERQKEEDARRLDAWVREKHPEWL